MTVRLEGVIRRYIGLSTDIKPVLGVQADGSPIAPNDLPAGSSFLESDTGAIYRWTGEAWSRAPADNEELYVLEALLVVVSEIHQMIGMALSD